MGRKQLQALLKFCGGTEMVLGWATVLIVGHLACPFLITLFINLYYHL